MGKYTLIIPSAKVVSEELQSIGKLPPIIYPVNGKIVFDYLLEQYTECEEIKVVCYEKCEKVHRRLEGYKARVNVIDLPELGDLAHTIYYGLEGVQGEAIINFSDTIVADCIMDIEGDCFFCSKDEVSDKWTFFEIENGYLTNIYDKVSKKDIGEKSLFVGIFKFSDAAAFKACLEYAFDNRDESMSSFYQALMIYGQTHLLKAVATSNWFDIGHLDRYYNTQLEVKSRSFNHIVIDRDRGILKKTSDDKEKFTGEILWYLKLPEDIEYVRPRIFSYSTEYNNPYVSMEYYSYHTLHELYLYGDLTSGQWREIFQKIRFVCQDMMRYEVKGSQQSIYSSLEDMYLKKTMKRLNSLRKQDGFQECFEKPICVNSVQYKSLNEICVILEKTIPKMLFDVNRFNVIHGDLCFSNIMVDTNLAFIKLIDPRGKFGAFDIYGDERYELAKLFHSVDGKYDFIIKDLFDIEYGMDNTGCRIDFQVRNRVRDYDLYRMMLEVFKDEISDDLRKIELIEALLFLSMIPLHSESQKHQMAMLATGIEILERVADVRTEGGQS